jgi:HSP20 family protein
MSALRDALVTLPDSVFADLLENDDAYLVVVDMPGATAETIDVTLAGQTLQIEARRQKDVPTEFAYLSEDRDLFLDVELPVPPDATAADATASVERGVLQLRLPKESSTSATTIPVEDG